MGRPPIKKSGVAMTNAERLRRHRAKVAKERKRTKRWQSPLSAALKDVRKRRIAAEICISADQLLGWFRDALREDDAKPTHAACEALSRELQTILDRPVQAEWEWGRQREKFRLAANTFLLAKEDYEDISGPDPSLRELGNVLSRFGAIPLARPPRRGRPKGEAWHMAAYPIAEAIKATLAGCGFRRRSSAKVDDSPVVIVGAKTISWAYKIRIKAAGFASAMKSRRRTMVAFIKSLPPGPHQGVEGVDFRTTERWDPPTDWDD
jgi:hypothetical protein